MCVMFGSVENVSMFVSLFNACVVIIGDNILRCFICRNRQRQSDSMISVVAKVIHVQLHGLVFVFNTKLHR